MAIYNYLQALLKPLFVYDAGATRSNAELMALGGALDSVCTGADKLAEECVIPCAADYGLEAYEEILPEKPVSRTLQARRNAVMALLQIDETSFTASALNAALSGCGIAARVEESGQWYTVTVTFPGTRGVPPDIDALKKRIEAILPCHLNIQYSYVFLTWAELEKAFPDWNALESGPETWDALQSWDV